VALSQVQLVTLLIALGNLVVEQLQFQELEKLLEPIMAILVELEQQSQ